MKKSLAGKFQDATILGAEQTPLYMNVMMVGS